MAQVGRDAGCLAAADCLPPAAATSTGGGQNVHLLARLQHRIPETVIVGSVIRLDRSTWIHILLSGVPTRR